MRARRELRPLSAAQQSRVTQATLAAARWLVSCARWPPHEAVAWSGYAAVERAAAGLPLDAPLLARLASLARNAEAAGLLPRPPGHRGPRLARVSLDEMEVLCDSGADPLARLLAELRACEDEP